MQQLQLQPPQPPQALQALQPLAQPLQPLQPLQPRWANCCPPSRGVPAVSLSKTKNVPKLTSKISSSMKVICGPAVSRNGTSGVGPTAPVADEPPASAIDTPTTPATGTAFFSCCFVRGIVETSHPLARVVPAALFYHRAISMPSRSSGPRPRCIALPAAPW
jgi:hypothetical protein